MNIEVEKIKLNIRKLETAKAESEFKILEKLADIERVKENIKDQEKAIQKKQEELEQLEGSL